MWRSRKLGLAIALGPVEPSLFDERERVYRSPAGDAMARAYFGTGIAVTAGLAAVVALIRAAVNERKPRPTTLSASS